MVIILKFFLLNVRENLFRTILIILSILLSTALYFGSAGLSKTIEKTYVESLKRYYGSAEIMIYPRENSPSPFLPDETPASFSHELEYAIGIMQSRGTYRVSRDEVQPLSLLGYAYGDLRRMHEMVMAEDSFLEPFSGRKVIISKSTAEKYCLNINDNLPLDIGGEIISFRISGIAQPSGIFLEDGRNTYAVVPKDFLNSLQGVRGKAGTIFLKLHDSSQIMDLVNRLSKAYPRYTVAETIKEEDIKEYTAHITQPFIIMVALVMLISIFIIYSSFKVIALERIPVIGTFRSIGATRRMVNTIFLAESLVYGAIGGLLGCFAGLGVLDLMARLTTPNWMGEMSTQVIYSPAQIAGAFFIALFLSFISAFLPVWRVAKIPVKDIVLNNLEAKKRRPKIILPLGIIFIILSLVLPANVHVDLAVPVSIVSMLLGIIGTILLLPLVSNLLLNILYNIYGFIFGNEGLLAVKNLKNNRNVLNNIVLLYIGIVCILVVKLVSCSVLTEVTSFFRDWKFDILATPYNADRVIEGGLCSIPGVDGVYGALLAYDIEIAGTDYAIGAIEGVGDNFFDFMNIDVPGGLEAAVEKLNSGRYILLSTLFERRLNAREGDILVLKTPRGEISYEVAGFLNTLENMGQYALIGQKYVRMDMGESFYNMLYIKTGEDPRLVQERIGKKYSRTPFGHETVRAIEERNYQGNQQLFLLLDGFSYMIVLIGIFAVFNNYIISFLERRRSFAMLRSAGMSRRQTVKMLLIEAVTCGVLAGVTGILGAIMSVTTTRYFLLTRGMQGEIQYDIAVFAAVFVTGITVSIIASAGPSLRTSRMNIIESLKYE